MALPTIGGVRLRRRAGETAFFYVSGMTIHADGSPHAYHPRGSPPGLDDLANAGEPGNFFGIVTDARGRPVVQRGGDPAPGFFVSTTALEDPSLPRTSPRRYVKFEHDPATGGRDQDEDRAALRRLGRPRAHPPRLTLRRRGRSVRIPARSQPARLENRYGQRGDKWHRSTTS